MLPENQISAFLKLKNDPELTDYQRGIIGEGQEDLAKIAAQKSAFSMLPSGFARKISPLIGAGFIAEDVYDGYNNRSRFDDYNWRTKLANAIAAGANGITIGLLPEEEVAIGINNLLGGSDEEYNSPVIRKILEAQNRKSK